MPPPTPQPGLPETVYASFSGAIDTSAVNRIMSNFGGAMAGNVKHVHLVFHSTGGTVGDGISLHNYFRALPIELTAYNCGYVQSIAVTAFLGAKNRVTSKSGSFLLHPVTGNGMGQNAERLKAMLEVVEKDDIRVRAIWREYLKLTDEQWEEVKHRDLTFNGEEAIKLGFADRLGEFTVPVGAKIFNI